MQKGLLSIEFARIPPNLLIKFEEILNKQEIDHKTSFLIGFLLAKSGEKPEEMPSIYDFLINKKNKAISKLQEEEEKEFLEEKAFIKKAENSFCKRPLLLSEEKKESLLKKKVNTYNSNEKTKEIKEYEKESIEKPLEIKENDESLCDICFNSLFSEPLYLLDQCPHIYHVNCLKQYLTTQIESQPRNPIKCPDSLCKLEISQRDLKNLLPNDLVDKYIGFSIQNYLDFEAKDASWCPNTNCKYAFINTESTPEFLCPLCKKHYCLKCRCDYHKGLSCENYHKKQPKTKEDSVFELFAKGQKFKQCGACSFWVEKTEGCDHMKCRCGNEFCYKCGGVYKKCLCSEDNSEYCYIF